ncbi:MAG TPA: beta-ketoacyl synthase chain length factor [Magnetospirillaceae bacterium]
MRVKAWTAWLPDRAGAGWQVWVNGRPVDTAAHNSTSSSGEPPVLLRRRVSKLGQAALRAAWELDESATARLIFASRHGEFGRTLSILDSLAQEAEVSPADFTLSVHHALAGLLSIARKNRQGHTTVAAGTESFYSGLLEAAMCLAERPAEPVVLVYYDEPLPDPYNHFSAPGEETIVLALALTSDEGRDGLRISYESVAPGAEAETNPGNAFLSFMTGPAARTTVVGERLAWRLEKFNAAA